ncbi:MAG: NADH-quinone oxidoreductase subunit J [Polyangiaceae bacterium]
MTAGSILFLVSAVLCVVGALATVLARNPIRGAMGLLTTIVGIALLFLKLAAQFLAAIQLIVYAGAVVVLFVFVIMLLGPDAGSKPDAAGKARVSRWVAAIGMAALSITALVLLGKGKTTLTPLPAPTADHGSTEAVGGLLFNQAIVPFELATALLIVAVIGAIAVARTKPYRRKPRAEGHEGRRLFGGPLHPRDAERPLLKEPAE